MKYLLLFIVGITSFFANAQFINLDKHVYKPGEKILVSFTIERDLPSDAWIGIIPAAVSHGSEAVNDKYDISYQYLKNGTRGTLVFKAPQKVGNYDFRLNDSDKNGKEIAMTAFEVSNSSSLNVKTTTHSNASPVSPQSLSLEKTQFKPGEMIVLHFTAPSGFARNAWIGIVPSTVKHGSEAVNDKYDLSYKYIEKQTNGVMQFTAPTKTGFYDFRMNDTDANGKEVTSLSFEVTNSPKKSSKSTSVTSNSTTSNQSSNRRIEGTYSTSFNKMTLKINGSKVTGFYDYSGGKIEGTLIGNELNGIWIQNNGRGKFRFIFNSDFSSFTGKWGYNNDVPTNNWNGRKI